MGQSLVKQYTHVVFSTKNRQALITEDIEQDLYRYIGGICKNLECYPVRVGGYRDHVHILCLLSKKVALMDLLENIKTHSSKWVKTNGEQHKGFYWQNGYGAFSVNPAEVDVVAAYIVDQHAHHSTKTFKEEYLQFLKKYGVEYDERYVWD